MITHSGPQFVTSYDPSITRLTETIDKRELEKGKKNIKLKNIDFSGFKTQSVSLHVEILSP